MIPSRVVVLGRKGFVPAALVRFLVGIGWPVLALGKDVLDLTEKISISQLTREIQPTDALVMTAALTPEKGKDLPTMIKNLQMAEHVAATLLAKPCAQLIYFSSDSVYGWEHAVISETTPPSPDNLYGVMHLAREIGLREACKKSAIPFAVLRPCAIYGTGDTHNAYGPNRFVRTALGDGKIELFGIGDDSRDQIYIDDVVHVTRLVLENRSEGLLNLASGTSITFAQVGEAVAEHVGRPIKLIPIFRAGPATFRSFEASARISAFPSFSMTPLHVGLTQMLKEANGF